MSGSVGETKDEAYLPSRYNVSSPPMAHIGGSLPNFEDIGSLAFWLVRRILKLGNSLIASAFSKLDASSGARCLSLMSNVQRMELTHERECDLVISFLITSDRMMLTSDGLGTSSSCEPE